MRLGAGVRLGPYEILGFIGAGGMAEVYRARDTRLGREVAVKVISEGLGADGAFVERFEREATLVGSVNHPNVIALYDVGMHDGKPYFVTELLQGETLRTHLEKGAVPLTMALDWAMQMADGLAAAHERGIVHRDLKPENVLVTRDRHVKLLDFGIAKVIAAAQEPRPPGDANPHDLLDETMASGSGRTGTGVVIGTPGYMSPEQVRGEPVDARSDIFSLGTVLCELLSGKRAFPGASAVESGYAILHQDPEPLPNTVPPTVAQLIRRCLEKDPGHRFQSARDLAFHLGVLRAPTTATAVVPSVPANRVLKRWWLAAAALVLVIVGGATWELARGRNPTSAARQRGGPASGPSAIATATPSIAVLPFVNLSSDKEQEYFSDGITEELLDALVRVKELKVAGRTSSFQFKGKNQDLRSIGENLGVANILEGSVRKQGNRVRITAQLIKAADGFQLWSHTFEGDLTNVFDLQEKIARSITDELKIVLQGEQRSRLVPVATKHPEAYALYLQATAIFNRRDGARLPDGIAALEQALRLDPGYARAWSRLAALWAIMPNYQRTDFEGAMRSAEQAARRATELDPSLAEPHAVLGLTLNVTRRFEASQISFDRALELDPDDVTANFWLAVLLMELGYVRASEQTLDRVLAVDPLHPNALNWRGVGAIADGENALAERLFLRARDAGLSFIGLWLSYVAEMGGRPGEAAARLTEGLQVVAPDLPDGTAAAVARGVHGDAQARADALARVEAYLASRPKVVSGGVPYALMRLGQPAQALEVVARGPTSNDSVFLLTLWTPYGREVRRLPGFSEAVRRMGMVDIWEKRGPPDRCRRVEAGNYLCD